MILGRSKQVKLVTHRLLLINLKDTATQPFLKQCICISNVLCWRSDTDLGIFVESEELVFYSTVQWRLFVTSSLSFEFFSCFAIEVSMILLSKEVT